VSPSASVKIEWVDCASLHLEFDSSTKSLKLFRFPSLCYLMCSATSYHPLHHSLLYRIFQDSVTSSDLSSPHTEDAARQFFKEILLSYRLIFSQTKSSRKTFNKHVKKWGLKSKTNSDPMLYRLCGNGCDADEVRELYLEAGADDPSNHYNPAVDFPFLGKRFDILQDYVQGHNPSSLWALWHDRRNVSWWWAFWTVIIIGGLGLLIGFAQVVLQILQLMGS